MVASDLSGQQIKGYALREQLGSGGFGAVYRAYQEEVQREVAIKIILPRYANQPDFIRRFEAEAQTIAQLEHPYIVPLYDYWRDPHGAYLVMRLLRGGSIRDILRQNHMFDIERIALLLGHIASALHHAHQQQVIHRDIKPDNILLDESGIAYLADFGIAKNLSQNSDGTSKEIVGSLDYLSPEQARSEPITARTDIYSLGVVLYELLVGEHPFHEVSSVERMYKHISDPLPDITNLEPDLNEAMNEIIQRATQKNPKDRYPDVLSLARAFAEAAQLTIGSPKSIYETLTSRELDILRLVADDLSNQEIAEKLVVEHSTIRWYIRQINKKLRVFSRRELKHKVAELGWFDKETSTTDASPSQMALLWEDVENPYKGLRAFERGEAQDFFGREEFVQRLVWRMQEADPYQRFLAIVGPSGSGKSSVARAGLLPALVKNAIAGSDHWFSIDMIPGESPFDALETALIRIAADQAMNLHDQINRDERGLVRAADLILPKDKSELLLLIDQFEEVFTLVTDEDTRRKFLDLLLIAVTAVHSRVRVIVTLRADFYDRPLQYPQFGEMLRARMETILPLTAQGIERAIVGPVERMGMTFDDGLVAQIVSETTYQAGALPLLQFALTALFDLREGHKLTHEAYQQIGGVGGALANRIEDIYRRLDPEAQEAVRQLLLRLVTLGEGVEDTRRRVPRSELVAISNDADLMDDLIDFLAQERFLALDNDPATRAPMVEVAHEAILREWERLRAWLNESRADIRVQQQVTQLATEWAGHEKDPSYLAHGSRLQQFEDWIKQTNIVLTPHEQDYIKASIAERDRQQAEQRAQREREAKLEQRSRAVLRALVAVFALATLLSLGLVGLTVSANNRTTIALADAEAAEQEALAQAGILLASQAESALDDGAPDLAVLLGLEALQNYPYSAQAEHALGRAVSYNRALQIYDEHLRAITSADWSPDETKVATASTDNTVRIWDANSGETLQVLEMPEGISGNIFDWVLAVKWLPDGDTIVTLTGDRFLLGSQDYDLLLWDVTTGQQISSIELENDVAPQAGEGTVTSAEHYHTATSIDIASMSGRIATVGGDNTAIIWDLSLQEQLVILTGHENAVNSVAWSPDEAKLATTSEDGTVRIWDSRTGEMVLKLSGHEGAVNQVIWSPDGSQIFSAGRDATVQIWDAIDGSPIRTLNPEGGVVWSIDLSGDGKYLATATNDARVRIWNLGSFEIIAGFGGHQNFVTQAVWSSDKKLLTTDASGIARLWNAAPTASFQRLPYIQSGEPSWTSDSRYFSIPTGDWWAGTTPDNLVVWDVEEAQAVAAPIYHREGWYTAHANYSPDDQLLLVQTIVGPFLAPSGGPEARTFVVDAATGDLHKEFALDEEGSFIRTAAWSPNGRQVGVGTSIGTLAIWDYGTEDMIYSRTCGEWINTVGWSPDGSMLAINCNSFGSVWQGWIEILDAESFEHIQTLPDTDPPSLTQNIAWAPDSQRILVVSGDDSSGTSQNPARIWDARSGELLVDISRHTSHVWWGSWSPNSERIATGSTDDTTRIWDAHTGGLLLTLSTPNNWLVAPEWSPNGQYLAIGTYSFDVNTVTEVWRVWQTTEDLIEYANDCCIFRDFTPEEREQYGLSEPE